MRHDTLSTCSKFLITRERAKPRFRAKIGDFRANRAVSRQDGWRGSRMKERRSFSCGCAKIHELPTSVFLLSFCLSSLCLSCLSCLSLSRPLPLESRVIASSVVSRRVSPRREESRVIASSVVSRRLSSRCASSRSPCASSELLDVSR